MAAFYRKTMTSTRNSRLDAAPDTPIETDAVWDSVSTQAVEVDAVGNAQYQCPAGESLAANQFYITGTPAMVNARTFNQPQSTLYENQCILLPLTAVQIPHEGSVINLNPGDGHPMYAESRRCVIFKTGPNGSSC
eukprot:TRINITY_DN9865_c0_g1_i2.p1 TRINITY_DN9865_c0_g1~~TRINITY_DN9865_c0_g1_i2.p1  ORF type:complete len:143 (-),score=1.16 TRINITY_DN9865_c0_g1_i2:771-1175(-)